VTRMHRASNTTEAKRIYWAGGFVVDGYVNGELMPTRSFGDFQFKSGNLSRPDEQIVLCVPDIIEIPRTNVGGAVVLASDGIFDVLSLTQVQGLCTELADRPADEVARMIVNKALELGSRDNVTCVVVYMHV